MADKVEKILDIKVNYNDAIKAIVEYQDKIKSARDAEAKLKEQLKAGGISREQYNEEMVASKAYITDCNDSIRVITKTMQNQIKQEKAQENSLVSLRAQLSNLTAEYDALSEAERNGAKGTELKDNINGITDSLKGAEESTQRYYRNVGNYTESLSPLFDRLNDKLGTQKKKYEELVKTQGKHSDAAKRQKKAIEDTQLELDLFSEAAGKADGSILNLISSGVGLDASIIKTIKQMGSLSQGAKMVGIAIKGLSMQLLALMANPVVAFLALVAVGILAVSKGISSSEANTNRWKAALAPFNRLLNEGIKILQIYAGWILSYVEAGGKMLEWLNKMGEKLPIIGKHFKEQNDKVKEGIELEKEKIAIEQQGRKNEVQNAKDALAVSELRTKAKDKEKFTAKERLEFVKQANKLEEEQSKRNVELAERKLKALQIESEWADNDASTNEELAKREAAVYVARKAYFDKTRELKEQENTLIQEEKTKEQAALTAKKEAIEKAASIRSKELAEVRKAEDELLKLAKEGRNKQSTEISRSYNRQIEDLRIRLKTESDLTAKAKDSINQQIIALEKQKSIALHKLSDEVLSKELEQRQKLISLRLESAKEGSEQEYQLKMQQLQAQREAELSNKELTEEMKLAIQDKYNKQFDDLATQHEQEIINKQQEAMRIRFETEIAQAKGNHEEILRIKIEQKQAELDSLQQLESESLEAFNLRKIKLQNEYLSAKQELSNKEIEIETKKIEALSALAGNLSSLIDQAAGDNEEMARLAKVLAIAEIAIAQGVAIAQAVKTATSSSATWIDMLVAIGTVVASVTTVMGTAMKSVKSAKFADGGLVTGPGTGTSDSIPTQLSNGESVITAKATSMFAPILSSFNMMGGGVPISVTATNNQSIGEDMLARAVAKGMMMAPAPIVSVEEFTSVADRVKYIEESGSL